MKKFAVKVEINGEDFYLNSNNGFLYLSTETLDVFEEKVANLGIKHLAKVGYKAEKYEVISKVG